MKKTVTKSKNKSTKKRAYSPRAATVLKECAHPKCGRAFTTEPQVASLQTLCARCQANRKRELTRIRAARYRARLVARG